MELRCEKLGKEIEQLQRPWWKRAPYLAVIASLTVAIAGFFSALLSGYFDSRRSSLEDQIGSLEVRRDALQSAIDVTYGQLRISTSEALDIISIISNLREANRNAQEMITGLKSKPNVDPQTIFRIETLYSNNQDAADRSLTRLRSIRDRRLRAGKSLRGVDARHGETCLNSAGKRTRFLPIARIRALPYWTGSIFTPEASGCIRAAITP